MKELDENRKSTAYYVGDVKISRAYEDEVCIKLPCGYGQRFFSVDLPDSELIERCKLMKSLNIDSSSDLSSF